jgi:hypothetical protein
MAIHNRHDFQALSAPRRTDFRAAALGRRKGCVDEALFFVERAVLAKFVGDVSQNTPQHFIVAPVLKAPMHGLIVRIALRQHVPLSTRVQNPRNRFQNSARRNRLPTRSPISNVLLRKVFPDAFPLLVRQPNHSPFIAFSSPIDSSFQF